MNNECVDGVVAKIFESFPDIPIYTEDIEQDLAEPSFMVDFTESNQEHKLDKRYYRSMLINVHYFPSNQGNNRTEINSVFNELFEILEFITIGENLIMGKNFETHIEDDVGIFTCTYGLFFRSIPEGNGPFESVESDVKPKNE